MSLLSGCLISLDYGKKRGCTREEREKERLKHKYKKEFKGALREIRKDSRFLAREKLNEVMNRYSRNQSSKPLLPSRKKNINPLCLSVFQRCREEEEGEGTVWQFGHSGGRVEGAEEEEEEVKFQIFYVFIFGLLKLTFVLISGSFDGFVQMCLKAS